MKNLLLACAAVVALAGCGSVAGSGVSAPSSAADPTRASLAAAVVPASTAASSLHAVVPAPATTHASAPPVARVTTPTTHAAVVPPATAAAGKTYTNVDGKKVPVPTSAAARPAGATAQCNDGTYSFSLHHQGSCSHHGGVAKFFS
jgi:uncharacterized protein YceK